MRLRAALNLRGFLTLAAVVTCILGLRLLVIPGSFVTSMGLQLSEAARILTRAIGAFQLGIAAINWYAREDVHSPVVTGVVIGNILYHALTLVVYGAAAASGSLPTSATVLFEMGIQGLFIVGFAVFWAIERGTE